MEDNGRLAPDPLMCNRALAAWLLSTAARPGPEPDEPRPAVHLCQHGGYRYAVITGASTGVLAVYRVHPGSTLVRLDRWPGEIENYLSARPAAEELD